MATSVKNKRLLCRTSTRDFNIGSVSGSPVYNRYGEVVRSVNTSLGTEEAERMLAQPVADTAKGCLDWYVQEGEWTALSKLSGEALQKSLAAKRKTVAAIKEAAVSAPDSLRPFLKCIFDGMTEDDIPDEFVFTSNGSDVLFVAWGMRILPNRSASSVLSVDPTEDRRSYNVRFSVENGSLKGKPVVRVKHGHKLGVDETPSVEPHPHFVFTRWEPEAPQGKEVKTDMEYVAICEQNEWEQTFNAAEGGRLEGASSLWKPMGAYLSSDELPTPVPEEGYEFEGWDVDPTSSSVDGVRKFTASFRKMPEAVPVGISGDGGNGTPPQESEPVNPPVPPPAPPKSLWQRFKDWLAGLGCGGCLWTGLKWLLLILLFFLVLWLLFWLFRGCDGVGGVTSVHHEVSDGVGVVDDRDGRNTDVGVGSGGVDGNAPKEPIYKAEPGIVHGSVPKDQNGSVIVQPDERGTVTPPVVGDDGSMPPVVSQPGRPDVIANRLNIFFEEDDADLRVFAQDFKEKFPGKEYKIIGYDDAVKMVNIEIPEAERDRLRESLPSMLPRQKFFVVDETLLRQMQSSPSQSAKPGWHIDAIGLRRAWQTTKGRQDVVVAIVDDGLDLRHPMFSNRIVSPYNVFTQDSTVEKGDGHGTHVAGLAVGNSRFLGNGAAGVAPDCSLMPVQVYDHNRCPFSALAAGIMYALHKGADVVNVSTGLDLHGMAEAFSPSEQEEIAQTVFKNDEKVWRKIVSLAQKKKTVLVFAAGNDNILAKILPELRIDKMTLNVAAVDSRLRATVFTNHGSGANISAPGQDILSAYTGGRLEYMDGTSMATPIVSGCAALLKSVLPDVGTEKVIELLRNSASGTEGGAPPMVRIDKALSMALGDTSDPYADIRRQIEECRKKIEELEKQLPENK